ncbi:methylated-DNA--[protein]-cysteine S-methyltransferase [Streptomyces sp. NPDC048282]|uniref:methylated-DNA--[protein]-cysteine S-methyltransferase n=1 Tax=Streptomyces sp. NPDC048282 TaxID=3365528 RepID=UPI00371C78E4
MDVSTVYDSPLGELRLTGEESPGGVVLTALSLPGRPIRPADRADRLFTEALRQLDAYFAGRLTRFDLPCAARGTDFQQRVWRALDGLPYGTTTTYGELAALLGAAVGANPLLLIRPCHRVIGADGSMRGYAGGVENKVRLLTHEGALQPMLG